MSKPQLICFTHAGGTSAFFDKLEKDLPDYEMIKLEYSGHGKRYKEVLFHNIDELVEDLLGIIKSDYILDSYALMGYSMGSIVLIEVLKRIINDPNMKNPIHVFLAAHEPNSRSELVGFTDNELDYWVKERTLKFGEIPEKLENNTIFWRIYLPVYRADYCIICNYNFENIRLSSTIPATVFYSDSDTPKYNMELWRKYFIGDFKLYNYCGSHFFINDYHLDMSKVIKLRMQGE